MTEFAQRPAGSDVVVRREVRVIIADDDFDTRELVTLALATVVTSIEVTDNGADLVRRIRDAGPYDLIITDVQMPVLEGLDAVTAIRDLGIATPVLVITGVVAALHAARLAELRGIELLHKPFQVSDLRRAVARLLAGHGP